MESNVGEFSYQFIYLSSFDLNSFTVSDRTTMSGWLFQILTTRLDRQWLFNSVREYWYRICLEFFERQSECLMEKSVHRSTLLYVLIRSPPSHRSWWLVSFMIELRCSGSKTRPSLNKCVILFWTFSIMSISPWYWGFQTSTAYSRCGRTYCLYIFARNTKYLSVYSEKKV